MTSRQVGTHRPRRVGGDGPEGLTAGSHRLVEAGNEAIGRTGALFIYLRAGEGGPVMQTYAGLSPVAAADAAKPRCRVQMSANFRRENTPCSTVGPKAKTHSRSG